MTKETKEIKKAIVGVVLSDKMEKTRTVISESVKKHPVYGKYVKTRKKFMVHDEDNKSKAGDQVVLQETKPISKGKKWVITEILGQAK